jgi:hypothetical protein
MNELRPQFRFSIANLLLATALVALAAWVATLQLPFKIMPIKITDQNTGAISYIELPVVVVVLGLIGAAIGVIIRAQPTLGRSAYAGCVLLPMLCIAALSIFLMLQGLFSWLMRLLS